jgi:tetratricopeptide (TPR) repeat protein
MEANGRLVEAERHYQRAIFLRPGYWPTHHWLAIFYKNQGRYDAAINQFNRVIELAPDYDGGYNNLGMMYLYLGDNDRARGAFERSLAIEGGTNSFALSNLGLIYFAQSRFDDSVRMFERSVAIDDRDDSLWGNLAFAYNAAGNEAKSHEALQRAIDLGQERLRAEPDNTRLLCDLASYHATLGGREQALEALKRAVATKPTDPQLVADVAEAFEDVGDREQALQWVERAFDLGVSPSRFEGRPSLRGLLADERYRSLTASPAG